VRLSYFFGAHSFYFSGLNVVGPLMGIDSLSFLGLSLLLTRRLITGVGHFTLLSYHIPTIFASAYWASSNIFIRLLVPLACMILFIMHPVGYQVPFYTLYWLIPIALYFFAHKNIFVQALGSTFVAHAVGSVLWIYALPTVPAYWYALIPVVAVERLLLCTGMIILHAVGGYIMKQLERFVPGFSVKVPAV